MAIDYWHRLLVEGPPADVRGFYRAMWREFPRTVARKTWTEVVPFSFASLHELAPAARTIVPNPPCEPFDLSAWEPRRLTRGVLEVRYQFHTRNLEMQELLRVLSAAVPGLTFTLATLCLDASEIDAARVRAGKVRHWHVPERLFERHITRVLPRLRREQKKAGPYVPDPWAASDPEDQLRCDARDEAEEELFHVALSHWRTDGRVRRPRWWNRTSLREILTEMELDALEWNEREKSRRKARARR